MKRLFFPIIFLALAPLSASAQNSRQYLDCSHNAQTQAVNACADQELKRVETELNGTYHALMAETAQQAEAAAKIKSAQKAWLVFRDAYLEAMYPDADKQSEYGSLYPMQVALLRAKLSRQQTAALKDLLRQHTD